MSYRKFDLTVRELSPILDDWYEPELRRLIDDFAGFAASRVNRQLEYLRRLHSKDPVCQIARANEHVGSPKVADELPPIMSASVSKQRVGNGRANFIPTDHRAFGNSDRLATPGIVDMPGHSPVVDALAVRAVPATPKGRREYDQRPHRAQNSLGLKRALSPGIFRLFPSFEAVESKNQFHVKKSRSVAGALQKSSVTELA